MAGGDEGSKLRGRLKHAFAWNASRICMSPCRRKLLYFIYKTRELAAPMIALPNPNPKLEAPSNLALR